MKLLENVFSLTKNMEMPRLAPLLTAHGLKYNPQSTNKALENSSSLHTVVWKTLTFRIVENPIW